MSGGLVVITSAGSEQKYVTNCICAALDVQAILVTDLPARRSWKTVLKKSPAEFLDKALWRTFLKVIGDEARRGRDLRAVFGDECLEFREAAKVIEVGRPKAGRLRKEVERLAPDHIAVYGTGIIPDSVLAKARLKAFNMHTGISPQYRGTSCAFWPIYYREPEMVGATVHECVAAVDGGEIYRIVKADLFRGDSLHKVFARAAKAGAEAYVQVLQDAIDGRLTGHKQDLSEGREFRGAMRGLRAELLTRWRLADMQRRWPIKA